jgi:hypothetical protein
VGAWIGGLVWLTLAVRRSAGAAQVRRYSNVAAVGLGVVLTTGLVRATDELGGPGWWLHALDNDYGTALVVKLALVVPLVSLGALNRFRNVRRYPALGPRPLLRTVGSELVLAAGVLALAGVLTGLPPEGDRAPAEEPAAEPLVVTGSDFATTTRVRLEIAPGTVGPNVFVAKVTDYDTEEVVEARRVALTFRQADRPEVTTTVELERRERAWQAGATALSIQGIWEVEVLVETFSTSVEVPLLVAMAPPGQSVDVTRAEGQPELHTFVVAGGTLQVYVDPGEPGRTNQVHVTAFDPDGFERPLEDVAVLLRSPGGATELTPPEPLSPGHVVVNVPLEAGTTGFAIDARADNGGRLVAVFEQRFEG